MFTSLAYKVAMPHHKFSDVKRQETSVLSCCVFQLRLVVQPTPIDFSDMQSIASALPKRAGKCQVHIFVDQELDVRMHSGRSCDGLTRLLSPMTYVVAAREIAIDLFLVIEIEGQCGMQLSER